MKCQSSLYFCNKVAQKKKDGSSDSVVLLRINTNLRDSVAPYVHVTLALILSFLCERPYNLTVE